ncbi:MAG TPA: hypothetical protein VFO60_07190 [Candidatus Dormibacteraeota bacterium]|nr:hypothetical protein [Candidatus Dormibacteraeota bacterium]
MEEKSCRWHRRRPAQATCVSCAAPVCADCLVQTRVGVKCRGCAGVRAGGGSTRRIAAIAGSGVAVAAVAVVIAVHSHGSAPGSTQPSPPAPSASVSTGPEATPIPCSLLHSMC